MGCFDVRNNFVQHTLYEVIRLSNDIQTAKNGAKLVVGAYCTKEGIESPGLTPVELEEGDRGWFRDFVDGDLWWPGCYASISLNRTICGAFSQITIEDIVTLLFVAAYLTDLGITHIGQRPFEQDYRKILDYCVSDSLEEWAGLDLSPCRCDP